jgi:hypothetical protein
MTTTIQNHIGSTYDGKFAGDARHPLKDGEIGFLLELSPVSNNPNFVPRKRLELRPHPVRQAGTLEELLFGTVFGDRTDVEALGVAIVTEVAVNGRGRVKTLWGDEATEALDKLGYPDLASDLVRQYDTYVKQVYQDA